MGIGTEIINLKKDTENKNIWYDMNKLMGYNALLNFVLSHRGGGKTYGFIKRGIKRFLKSPKNDRKQTMYVRRYKEELNDSKSTFFDAVKQEFPDVKFEVKGNKGFINDEEAFHFVSLSTSNKKKSVSYPFVDTIIFDEFIVDKGLTRYVMGDDEPLIFNDLMETVGRLREITQGVTVKCYFLANAISIVNPYFKFWNCIPRKNRNGEFNEFSLFEDGEVLVHMYKNSHFNKQKKATRWGRLVSNTQWGAYAIDNEFLKDDNTFICKKPKGLTFKYSLNIDGTEIGFHFSRDLDYIYADRKIDKTSKFRFTLNENNHDFNFMLITNLRSTKQVKFLLEAFRFGRLNFSDQEVKNKVYEIIGLFTK